VNGVHASDEQDQTTPIHQKNVMVSKNMLKSMDESGDMSMVVKNSPLTKHQREAT